MNCPICELDHLIPFFSIQDIPIFCNLLWETRQAALEAPKGNIDLVFCQTCGLIYNQSYDPQKMNYAGLNYENPLHHSAIFQKYAEELAQQLTDKFNLDHKKIVEIGCGDGYFLSLLCQNSACQAFGFDPSLYPNPFTHQRLTLIQETYSSHFDHVHPDMIVSRHVLEHIYDPRIFLSSLSKPTTLDKPVFFFFEVPNVNYTLQRFLIWDIIYEHFAYYSKPALEYLFQQCNLEPISLYETYQNQFLCIEGSNQTANVSLSNDFSVMLAELSKQVRFFETHIDQKIKQWKTVLNELKRSSKNTVIWGSGSKGVMLLNLMKDQLSVDAIVDINPQKQGKFIPGTGTLIIAPQDLQTSPPDVVLITNPVYEEEIQSQLHLLNLEAQIIYV